MMSSENIDYNNNNPNSSTGGGDFDNDNNMVTDSDFIDEDISPIERGEVGASLPNAEEVRATVYAEHAKNGSNGRSGGRCSRKIMILALVALAVVAVSVGLGVGLANREKKQSSSASSSALDKNGYPNISIDTGKDPSADADSGPPPRVSTYTDVKNFVVAQGISLDSDFDDLASPQNRAATWMADIDGLNMAIPTDADSASSSIAKATLGSLPPSTNAYRFLARYILTVLYYSTNGEQWEYHFNFLSEGDVCSWSGALVDTTGSNYYPYGTHCDSNGAVWGLHLDRMFLKGSIPKELGKLTTLELLDMTFNDNLSGTFPEALCELTNLKALSLGYTQISGEIPACIAKMTLLRAFLMSDSLMGGPLPSEMSQLTNMVQLLLDDNAFTGDVTSMFNEMKSLEVLFIEDNDFSATLDENFLADCTNLTQLDMSTNNVQGTVPAHFFNITSFPWMQLLDLHSNGVSGALPDVPAAHEIFLFIALHDNSITGNIPTTWTYNFPRLFHLDVSNNALSGPMSPDIGNITSLRYLFLAENEFDEGPIPSSFANLTKLEEISLKKTLRNGEFPAFVTAWKELILLDLDNNALTGPLPEGLGNLSNLEFLLINRNQLSGEIPASLGDLINLRAAFLEQNNLTGSVDETICKLPAFDLGNGVNVRNKVLAADCGTSEAVPTKRVSCPCCTICCIPGVEDCHDESELANLDPEWEMRYKRVVFDFGNNTRLIDSDFLTRRD